MHSFYDERFFVVDCPSECDCKLMSQNPNELVLKVAKDRDLTALPKVIPVNTAAM